MAKKPYSFKHFGKRKNLFFANTASILLSLILIGYTTAKTITQILGPKGLGLKVLGTKRTGTNEQRLKQLGPNVLGPKELGPKEWGLKVLGPIELGPN